MRTAHDIRPAPPCELLREGFLRPMGISSQALARGTGLGHKLVREIMDGRTAISPETDLRLSRFLGLSRGYWLHAQADFDSARAIEKAGSALDSIQPWARGSRPP